MTGKNLAVVAILLWGASAAFVGYKFVAGSTVEGEDGREVILMDQNGRDIVLGEMRGMLAAVQEIIVAVQDDDMERVKKVAHRVGTAEVEAVPPSVMMSLPMHFKKRGHAMHSGFDNIALQAEFGKDAVLSALGDHMSKCVECHEGFQIQVKR